MSEYKFNNLSPFKFFILETFPFIQQEYFDAMNEWQLFCKLGEKINEIINSQNSIGQETEDLYDAFIRLQEYVNNYFDNLDVQDEINNKLNDMIESGEMEEIIGDLAFKKLDYYIIDSTITTAELQELLNINRKKIIEFTNGTYNFDNTLIINKNTTLICNHSIINNTNNHMFHNFKETDNFLEYNGNGNIEIVGGKFNACFSLLHGDNILIKDVSFYHVNNDHCMEICGCKNVTVDSCTFEGVLIQNVGRQYVENIQFENVTYQNFPWLPETNITYDGTACENIEIKNCKFNQTTNSESFVMYSAIGGHTYVENKPHNNIIIHDNEIKNRLSYGIRLHNIINSEIYNNKFIQDNTFNYISTQCIALYNGIKNIDIYNNVFDGNLKVLYCASGSETVNFRNNIIKNVLYNEQNEGLIITCRAVNNFKIINNSFIDVECGILYNLSEDYEYNNTNIEFSYNNISYNNINPNIYTWICRFYRVKNVVVANNTVNTPEAFEGHFIRLHEAVETISMIKNLCTRTDKILQLNGYLGSLLNVYDIPFKAYNGSSEITEDTELNYTYEDFNKMIVVVGNTDSTNIIHLSAFVPVINKLDSRTWNFPVYKSSDNNVYKASLTFNANGTFNFSCSDNNIHLRNIIFINE